MIYALDPKTKERIYIEDAKISKTYECPICDQTIIVKRSVRNRPYYTHVLLCSDGWEYEATNSWEVYMQSLFKPEERDVVIEHNGRKHRVDVLKDGVVLEFLRSPHEQDYIIKRNKFYLDAGYRVVWVIDQDGEKLRGGFIGDGNTLEWKYNKSVLKGVPFDDKDISICLFWYDENGTKDLSSYHNIGKILWASTNENGETDYRKIIIHHDFLFDIGEDMNMDMFFFTPKDWAEFERDEINRSGYIKKYVNKGGLEDKHYKCNLGEDEKVIDESNCKNCKFCGQRLRYTEGDKKVYMSACYKPCIVNENEQEVEIMNLDT